ncbi:MAG: flagellar protein FlaG [Proteobacteria bacterium]|nr:flagellar protein FlaG [Pseudomonadota bacterium]
MDNLAINVNGPELMGVSQLHSVEKSAPVPQKMGKVPAEEKTANASSQMSTQDVKEILDSFKELSKTIQTKLNFSVSKENNEIIVKVIDKESNQLIRQFPSEEMLNLQDKMRDMAGFLLDANV